MAAAAAEALPEPPPSSPPRASCKYAQYEELRAPYDRSKLQRFFACRPLEFVSRVGDFYRAWLDIRESWYHPPSSVQHGERGARLRNQLAVLGPVAVKLGQTLSQRPDILDEEICEELKPLQTANRPFADADALALLAEELKWVGPIAPGIAAPGCLHPDGPPLFASISASPVASASLGQVYKAVTRSGADVAVKVQRPSAMRQVALDFAVLTTLLWLIQRAGWGNGDLVEIIDIVADGVFQEMDYRNEARNAVQFDRSLSFLGYVSVPKAAPEFPPTPRVLVTEWVHGRHLGDLTKREGLRMTKCAAARVAERQGGGVIQEALRHARAARTHRASWAACRVLAHLTAPSPCPPGHSMAVDAVTASLVLTGIVHADPHEGNIMLGDNGRLYFLDFGLMSEVKPEIMEAFAYGIQCVLNKDYDGLVQAFIATGFVASPIEYRRDVKGTFGAGSPDDMAAELAARMEAVPGGTSRFGALSTVLFDMGKNWRMYTPPYIILLIRTFLTLEGIASQVDPAFNIYEVSLPWAVQRALSPATAKGAQALRDALLTRENKLRWDRVHELVEQQMSEQQAANGGRETSGASSAGAAARATPASAGDRASGTSDPLNAVKVLLGSPGGSTLRRIARDVDSTELLTTLTSPRARQLRRAGVHLLAEALTERFTAALSAVPRPRRRGAAEALPVSHASEAMRRRRRERLAGVRRVLVASHLKRQLRGGWKGAAALGALAILFFRVGVVAFLKAALRSATRVLPSALASARRVIFGV